MKIGIIGSREVIIENLENYLPDGVREIVSGGARGVDKCAADFAHRNGIKLVEFLPQYSKYGRNAPLMRNREIVEYSDRIIAFWDGKSRGTLSVIRLCEKCGKDIEVVLVDEN